VPRTATTTTERAGIDEDTTKVVVVADKQREKAGLVDGVSQSAERFQQGKDHIAVGCGFTGSSSSSRMSARGEHTLMTDDCRSRTGKQQVEDDQRQVKTQ